MLPGDRASTRQQGGNSLAVQWLGLRTLTAKGPGLIPGRGTNIPTSHSVRPKKKKKGSKVMKTNFTYLTALPGASIADSPVLLPN